MKAKRLYGYELRDGREKVIEFRDKNSFDRPFGYRPKMSPISEMDAACCTISDSLLPIFWTPLTNFNSSPADVICVRVCVCDDDADVHTYNIQKLIQNV